MGSSLWPRSISDTNWSVFTRPMSIIASMAARAVRPVNSTSSTMIMSLPVTVKGTSVDLTCGCSLSMDKSSR